MTTVSSFFKHDADQNLGVFYPTNYLVAIFPSQQIAMQARNELAKDGGIKDDDMLVLSGDEFIRQINRIRDDASLWAKLTAKISEVVGTEEMLLDYDLKQAEAGGAFLAVYCPTAEQAQEIFRHLKHLAPLSMRRYSPYTLDRMV